MFGPDCTKIVSASIVVHLQQWWPSQDPAKKDQHRTGLKWTDNPEGMYFFRIAFYNVSTLQGASV
jgi:hypothetical protein